MKKKCIHSNTKNLSSNKVVTFNVIEEKCLDCNMHRYVTVTPSGGKEYSKWFTPRS